MKRRIEFRGHHSSSREKGPQVRKYTLCGFETNVTLRSPSCHSTPREHCISLHAPHLAPLLGSFGSLLRSLFFCLLDGCSLFLTLRL